LSLFDCDGWSGVGVHMSRGAPGSSAAGTGSNAEPAQTLAAHAFQENLCYGQEPRPGAPWFWWVFSVPYDGTWTWTSQRRLYSVLACSTSILVLSFIPSRMQLDAVLGHVLTVSVTLK
jgi:hypothetical protein